jgi:hypothetical protein
MIFVIVLNNFVHGMPPYVKNWTTPHNASTACLIGYGPAALLRHTHVRHESTIELRPLGCRWRGAGREESPDPRLLAWGRRRGAAAGPLGGPPPVLGAARPPAGSPLLPQQLGPYLLHPHTSCICHTTVATTAASNEVQYASLRLKCACTRFAHVVWLHGNSPALMLRGGPSFLPRT